MLIILTNFASCSYSRHSPLVSLSEIKPVLTSEFFSNMVLSSVKSSEFFYQRVLFSLGLFYYSSSWESRLFDFL